MNQKHLFILYLIVMGLLATSWIYLESQTTVTRTCYEYDREIPCDLYEQKMQQFIPPAPENYTFNWTLS